MNLTINITQLGMQNITIPECPKCFNFSECPLPTHFYHSNYQANFLWLTLIMVVALFLMYRFNEKPFLALGLSGVCVLVLSIIGAFFGWISGLLLVIIEIGLVLYTLLHYRKVIEI